jgi:three-Cys-motif partner protein
LKFNFAKYFFFEADPACHKALGERIKTRAPEKLKNISLIRGDCNEHVKEVRPPSAPSLGLVFVDPTGISQIAFDTIRTLTSERKMDLIINFPEGMGIRMNLHQYTESEESALDVFMGTSKWKQRFHQVPTSFPQACRQIANEYLENLRSLGYQVLDDDQIPVRTTGNSLLYYLIFASKNPKGSEFWKKIGLIDPKGQRKLFS